MVITTIGNLNPTDHISISKLYFLQPSKSSGALYH